MNFVSVCQKNSPFSVKNLDLRQEWLHQRSMQTLSPCHELKGELQLESRHTHQCLRAGEQLFGQRHFAWQYGPSVDRHNTNLRSKCYCEINVSLNLILPRYTLSGLT